tara:strand:- start:48 stop:629 length:582 start_codon:yes stop_codon:yes gene_type:complete
MAMGLTDADREFFKKQSTFLEGEKKKNTFFDKDNIDAMKDSNYFNSKGVENVYDSIDPKAPVITGSVSGSVEKGDGKGFLDKQIDNYKAYLEATKEDKSDEDKDRDLIRELAGKSNLTQQFGDMAKGFSSEVAQGLNVYQPPSPNQQMFIPGQEATGKSFGQRLAGAAVGLGKGLISGTPHGGAFGAISGFFG